MLMPSVKEITNWDRRELELAFRESQKRLTEMVESAPLPIILQDLSFRYLLANEYARAVFWHGNDMVGKRPFDVWPPETAARFVQRAHSVVETQQPLTSEDVLPHPDGERTMLIHRFPLRDTSGKTSLIGAIGVDITAQKLAEDQAREAAALAEQDKREFRAGLSDRLRGPLNDVIGHARLLEAERLNTEAVDSVNGIMTAARQLLAVIEEGVASEQPESGGGSRAPVSMTHGSSTRNAPAGASPLPAGADQHAAPVSTPSSSP